MISFRVRSAEPLVVRATMLVKPIPCSSRRKSSSEVRGSGIRPERYRHFPGGVEKAEVMNLENIVPASGWVEKRREGEERYGRKVKGFGRSGREGKEIGESRAGKIKQMLY